MTLFKSIWKLYVKFDKSVNKADNKDVCNALCGVIRTQESIEEENYHDFCMKLVRNLGPFAVDHKNVGINSESCQFLYQWVYYMKVKYNIPDNFTKEIFNRSNTIISVPNEKHVCPYYSYEEKIHDPPNIIKIFNLSIVMNDLVSILMQDKQENNFSCRKFISECTKIYKDMNSDYCSDENKEDPKKEYTCFRLSTFKTFYESFIRTKPNLNSKLPSLTDDTMNDIISCESHKSREGLTSVNSEVLKPGSPMKIDTNAVLDTVGSNNIGKQAEYELFHNGPQDENISFDQTKYNVAYSPV
ncbi:hypothetical protein PVIIG_05221 [Plasmodium vivax India VII]|uniref:Variable surface protein n=1 Tax=Plasmodium vivax India VII TaxID=1077284 RepID=A0A0J9S2Q5_PLAVI|nr:hypothetical protein PVIIG_05221 [Plasmodium vivax India VII]